MPAPEIPIPDEVRAELITDAYAAADMPKPRKADGNLLQLSVPEMTKLLQADVVLTESDLRGLAMARAEAVKDHLVATGKVGPERLFIREPGPPADGGQARVVFGVK